MKKIITILGALTVASTPTIVLKNINPHKTQNLHNVITKTSNGISNAISVSTDSRTEFRFSITLGKNNYNGFSGFMNQITFKLSDYDYHAWPLYFFQWLDDNDFENAPFPNLNLHTKQGFFHDPFVWANRLENHMGHFGSPLDDKSDTAYNMSICWGQWGTFGQTVDNKWSADGALPQVTGIYFYFSFGFDEQHDIYTTNDPSFKLLTS